MSTLFSAFEIPENTIQSSSGASYTVPANYYAVVRSQVRAGESFYVNGVKVLGSGSNTWSAINSDQNLYRWPGSSAAGVSQSYTPAGLITGSTPTSATSSVNNVYPVAVFGNSTASDTDTASQTFRIKSGDVISGGRYHVELYKIPNAA